MSDKYCCVTWSELGAELASYKQGEIEALITTNKLPRSVFASVFRVLNSITQYCPVCGSNIDAQVAIAPTAIAVPKVRRPEPVTKREKCPRCAGKKSFGQDENNVVIKCMHCHGLGFVDQRHEVAEPKSPEEEEAEARIAELEKGDNE